MAETKTTDSTKPVVPAVQWEDAPKGAMRAQGSVPGTVWSYAESRSMAEMSANHASSVSGMIRAAAVGATQALGVDPNTDDLVELFGAFDPNRRIVVAVWVE